MNRCELLVNRCENLALDRRMRASDINSLGLSQEFQRLNDRNRETRWRSESCWDVAFNAVQLVCLNGICLVMVGNSRLNRREKFLLDVGFGEVVVGTEVQSELAMLGITAGSEYDDWDGR